MSCTPGGIDAMPDAPDLCFGADASPFMQLCAPPGAPPRTFGNGAFINTDSSTECDRIVNNMATNDVDACLVYGGSITITGNVRPHGARPLILFALGNLQIDGTLDVAGHQSADHPAGSPAASPGMCAVLTAGMPSNSGGGGGAGGGLGAIGGPGGAGTGGGAGANPVVVSPRQLRAGCDGSSGGDFMAATAHSPGFGGGAIYLAAGVKISFGTGGKVNASGGGGRGVQPHCGGDGGGSGGMIILDAPVIEGADAAQVYALGGGGSSGGAATDGGDGGESSGPGQPGTGGQSNMTGGPGGVGGGGISGLIGGSGGPGTANAAGGGGGGGGVGVIHLRTTSVISLVGFSPTPN